MVTQFRALSFCCAEGRLSDICVNFALRNASPRLTGPVKRVIFPSYNILVFRGVVTGMLSVFCVYFPAVHPFFPAPLRYMRQLPLHRPTLDRERLSFRRHLLPSRKGSTQKCAPTSFPRRSAIGMAPFYALVFRAMSDLCAYFSMRDSARSDMCGIFSPAPAFLTHKTERLPPLFFSEPRAVFAPCAFFTQIYALSFKVFRKLTPVSDRNRLNGVCVASIMKSREWPCEFFGGW